MTTIAAGSSIYLEFIFLQGSTLVDPDSIVAEVLVYDTLTSAYVSQATPETLTLNMLSVGVYETTWVTSIDGRFKVNVVGSFTAPEDDDIVHEKYFLIGNTPVLNDLDSSYLVTFLGALTPVYVDPEYILQYYPDGDLIEITEIIHRKSLELEDALGETGLTNITASQHDFVVAATMCELSRIYGLNNGGLTGFVAASSFKLGDLEVDKGSTGGGSSSGKYDQGNAASWCELAATLKKQLGLATGSMLPVVPGAIYDTPIPTREFIGYD